MRAKVGVPRQKGFALPLGEDVRPAEADPLARGFALPLGRRPGRLFSTMAISGLPSLLRGACTSSRVGHGETGHSRTLDA